MTIVYIFILAGIIFLADRNSTQYLLDFVGNVPHADKIGHFVLSGIFSLLLNLTLKCRKVYGVLFGNLIVLTVVVIEEFSQKFVRGRTFDWSDLIFDLAGIVVFGKIAQIVCRKYL